MKDKEAKREEKFDIYEHDYSRKYTMATFIQ